MINLIFKIQFYAFNLEIEKYVILLRSKVGFFIG
jgi:hypothetical protein